MDRQGPDTDAAVEPSAELPPAIVNGYAHVLAHGAAALQVVPEEVLAALEALRLVEVDDDVVTALSPGPPLGALLQERNRETRSLEHAAVMLDALWQQHHPGPSDVEMLSGAESERAYAAIIRGASGSIGALNRMNTGSTPVVAEGAFEALEQGVEIRVVYDAAVLGDREALSIVRSCMDAGEKARVLPQIPVSMIVSDSGGAISMASNFATTRQRMIIRPGPALTILWSLFEFFWNMALPVAAEVTNEPHVEDETRLLLTLLTAGQTDRVIAREMGISERTVGRRVTQLQARLGARTRFQLGVQALRNDWI